MHTNNHFDIANFTIALGFISTFIFGPVDLCRAAVNFLSVIIVDSQLFLGIVLGALTCVTFAAVTSALRHVLRERNCVGKYDPASPPNPLALQSRAASRWKV